MKSGANVYISVITPVYMSENSLIELYDRLRITLIKISDKFEIIMINDDSPDNSWSVIKELVRNDNRVKGISLSKNFGQHRAITAGLDAAKGDWIVVMDCDLQDMPEEIAKLHNKAIEGYDIVLGKRTNRQDNYFKIIISKIFYGMLSYFTETKQNAVIANFGIYHRKVVNVLKNMRESSRCFPIMVRWVGFSSAFIDISHANRKHGETSYSFGKLLNLAIDVFLAFSDKPLRLIIKLGFIISSISLMFVTYITIKVFLGFRAVMGWSSLIASIWLLSGLIIFTLGVVGIYVGKIFDDVKRRPLYIVKETLND